MVCSHGVGVLLGTKDNVINGWWDEGDLRHKQTGKPLWSDIRLIKLADIFSAHPRSIYVSCYFQEIQTGRMVSYFYTP